MGIDERREIAREAGVQGAAWKDVHLGYFSDPSMAAGLVNAILKAAAARRPDAVVDIGGGTGFLLAELDRRGMGAETALVDLDLSHAQIGAIGGSRIRGVPGSAMAFRRADLLPGEGTILYIMRSVLHYLGPAGLLPALRHIRGEMRPGEWFVHQTACFDTSRMADCISALYAGLGTNKRYPAASDLAAALESAGLSVREQHRCPALTLTSDELAGRYGRRPEDMAALRCDLAARYGDVPGVFEAGPDAFVACLQYRVFVTQAA